MQRPFILFTLFFATSLAMVGSYAASDGLEGSASTPLAITVYVDANLNTRKKGGAKLLNKTHREYEALGYRVLDIEIYTENGDMQGYFVTYVKRDDNGSNRRR